VSRGWRPPSTAPATTASFQADRHRNARTGVAAFIGDGANRWPALHRLDAARLFRLALENAAPGARLHGVAEEGVTLRAIAEVIGDGSASLSGASPRTKRPRTSNGWRASSPSTPDSSTLTRDTLGWRPQGPELLTDMRESGYFA